MGNYLTLQVETWSVMLPNTKRWNEDDMQQVQFVVREGRKEGRREGRREGRKRPCCRQKTSCLTDCLSLHPHVASTWYAPLSGLQQVSSGEFVLSVLALKDSSSSDSDPCPWQGSHQVTSRQNKASHHQDRCDWWWWCSWSIYRCFRSAVNQTSSWLSQHLTGHKLIPVQLTGFLDHTKIQIQIQTRSSEGAEISSSAVQHPVKRVVSSVSVQLIFIHVSKVSVTLVKTFVK